MAEYAIHLVLSGALFAFGRLWPVRADRVLGLGAGLPIQALAEATQAVARGNFDIRVLCLAEDELATLVESFNNMAAQLSENRHNLDLAAVEQRNTNRALEERRRYIETILQSLSTGIISLDNEHNLTTINQAALTILSCNKTPAPGTSLDQS